jgi:hypothetical protein
LHLRIQKLELELDHGDPQALTVEEQQIVVGEQPTVAEGENMAPLL